MMKGYVGRAFDLWLAKARTSMISVPSSSLMFSLSTSG
jgi:hypothetical protein